MSAASAPVTRARSRRPSSGALIAAICVGCGTAASVAPRAPSPRAAQEVTFSSGGLPVLFFQAENDFDLAPTRVLSSVMKDAGKPCEAKIYPRFGTSTQDGHSFAYRAASIWFDDVLRFLERHCAP